VKMRGLFSDVEVQGFKGWTDYREWWRRRVRRLQILPKEKRHLKVAFDRNATTKL